MKNFVNYLLIMVLAGGGQVAAWADEPAGGDADAAARQIASQVPDTDIYMIDIGPGGVPHEASLRNLTRRSGYDNQPAFVASGQALLFSSIVDNLQSDVYRVDLANGVLQQLTHTSQSEYSPTPLVGGGFSVVRVETDGAQHLWRYGADGQPANILVPQFDNVGYHLWLSGGRLALYLVGEPSRLVLTALNAAEARPVASDVGRSFVQDIRSGRLYFLSKMQEDQWLLHSCDADGGDIVSHLIAPGTSQDMALDKQGRVWMAEGKTIWRWQPGQTSWSKVVDFGVVLPGTITRLAFDDSDARLAIVVSVVGKTRE